MIHKILVILRVAGGSNSVYYTDMSQVTILHNCRPTGYCYQTPDNGCVPLLLTLHPIGPHTGRVKRYQIALSRQDDPSLLMVIGDVVEDETSASATFGFMTQPIEVAPHLIMDTLASSVIPYLAKQLGDIVK